MSSLKQNTSMDRINDMQNEKNSRQPYSVSRTFMALKKSHPFYKNLNYSNQNPIKSSYLHGNRYLLNNFREAQHSGLKVPTQDDILSDVQNNSEVCSYLERVPRKYSAEEILL